MQFQKDTNNNRIRQRRIYYQDNNPESDNGEMIYTDPNGNQVFSPFQDSPEEIQDFNDAEPNTNPKKNKSVFHHVRNDLKSNPEMVNMISDQPFPPLVMNINRPSRYPKYERTPQALNVGSSPDDKDYNIRTLNSRKSPNSNFIYNNNRDSNDAYLHSPYDDEDDYEAIPPENHSQRMGMIYRNRSPVINLNRRNKNTSPYGRPGAIPINKMSPEQNYEESNFSGEKQPIERTSQYNNLKNYLGKNNIYNMNYNQNSTNPNQNSTINNPQLINSTKDDIGNKYNNRTYNNMSYRDIKRIANRFTKVYDPNKNNNGILVEEMQVTVPGAQDDIFNNRYRVLAKMNRLSNILLAKQRRRYSPKRYNNRFDERSYDRYSRERSYNGKIRKPFDRHTLARSPGDNISKNLSRKAFSRSPEHKFLYVSLAMISSKGPSCEDRPILRRMRMEKGGVVDLAQEERKKTKFKIVNAQRKKVIKRNRFMNPKYRDKAAKIIQSWWRELKNIYNYRIKQIIKIQSAFRGKFVRKYMYDLFYLNFLYISFCKKIQNVLWQHVRPYIFYKLFGKNMDKELSVEKVPDKETLLERIISRDYRNNLETIYPIWKKWMSNTRRLTVQNIKGRNLVQIRADKEKKKGDIKNAFNKWKYICKILKAQEKLDKEYEKSISIEIKQEINQEVIDEDREKEREKNLQKIKGFFKLMDGINNLTKKEAMDNVLPKLEDYLKDKNSQNKLRNLLNKKPKYEQNLLRKYLFKWYAKTRQAPFEESKDKPKIKDEDNKEQEDVDEKINELRKKIYMKSIVLKHEKDNNNNKRKYFYKWYKKVIIIKIKEEKDKVKEKEKEFKDKNNEQIDEYNKRLLLYKSQKTEDEKEIQNLKNLLKKIQKEKPKDLKPEEIKALEKIDSKDLNKNLLDYLEGSEILQRAVRRITHKDPLDAFADKIDLDNTKKTLRNLLKIKKLSDKDLLKKYFDKWRKNALKMKAKDALYKLLAKLIEINSNNFKRKILAKKFNKWRQNVEPTPKVIDSLQKAKDIDDFVNIIKNALIKNLGDEFLDKLDKYRNPERFKNRLKRLYKRRENQDKILLRKALYRWIGAINNNLIIILKSKLLYNIYKKNNESLDKVLLNKYFQIWKNKTFNNNVFIYKYDIEELTYKHTFTKNLFVKSILKGLDKKTNQDLLREYFNRWKKICDLDKQQNDINYRKKLLLSKIFENRYNIEYITLLQYLLRWKNKMLEIRAKEAHKPYRKKVIKILLTKNDKEELQRFFTRWKYSGYKRLPIMPYIVAKRFLKKVLCRKAFKEFVKKMTERNPEVLKAKGKELIKAIKNIQDKRIRDFLDKLLKHIQEKYLGKIQPKIGDKVKEYYLKKYWDRWVENTLLDAQKKKELIARWLQKKFGEQKIKKDKKLKDLLNKFINKKDNYNKLNLANGFYKFHKNTKLDEKIENAKVIQKFCRGVLDTVIKERLLKRKELAKLLNKLYNKKFLNDLKQIAKEIAPILKEKEMDKKNMLDKLRNVIDKNDKMKRNEILKKYWDIWKNNKGLLDDCALILQKKVRQFLSKKKLDLMKKLNELLFKFIMANKDKQNELLYSKFYQWLKNSKKMDCHENARTIQKFCREKLDNYLKKKLEKYLDKLTKKYLAYLINNIAKVNELNKALKRKPYNDLIDNLKKNALLDKIKNSLLNLLPKQDDLLREYLLKNYLDKWRKKANQLKSKENEAASKIQSAFRGHNFRKLFNNDKLRTKLINQLIQKLLKASDPTNILEAALARWRKNAGKLSCHENARTIQKFCRDVHQKILDLKNKRNADNYKNLANILNNTKISPKEFFDKLKQIRRNQILNDLMNKIAQKRLVNLKDAFDEIKNYPKYKYLDRILPITDEFKDRILKKFLIRWRNKAMRYKGIMELLTIIFTNYDQFKNNQLLYNLRRWQYKAQYITAKINSRTISEFCKDIQKKKDAYKNWRKLADKLRKNNFEDDLDELYYNLSNLIALKKLEKLILHNAQKNVMDKLNKNNCMEKFLQKIRPYFDKNDEFWNNNLLKEYFDKWRNNTKKLRERDEALEKVLDNLEKYMLNNDIDTMANAQILKKFLHDYPLIRALGFLRKLKEIAKQKGKNEDLAKYLILAKDDIHPQKKHILIKKLYKVYAYKVLNKLFDNLQNLREKNAEPLKKDLLNKLFKNLVKKYEQKYIHKKELEAKPKNIRTSFKSKKQSLPKKDDKNKLLYNYILPALVKYLNNKIDAQNKYVFYTIKNQVDNEKFCKLYKSWAEKQQLEPKRELIDRLKQIYNYTETDGPLKLKLFKLLRKAVIYRLLKSLPKLGKVAGMMYITRLLVMKREIAHEKYFRQIIRRWRYITFSKKLAMNKMKTIYKNLHLTYLEMANCLFGDESQKEPSVIKEFERFGTSVGMWENEKPGEKTEEKFVKYSKTSYTFDPIEYEKYQNRFYPSEYEDGGEEYVEVEDEKEEIKENNNINNINYKGNRYKYEKYDIEDDKIEEDYEIKSKDKNE